MAALRVELSAAGEFHARDSHALPRRPLDWTFNPAPLPPPNSAAFDRLVRLRELNGALAVFGARPTRPRSTEGAPVRLAASVYQTGRADDWLLADAEVLFAISQAAPPFPASGGAEGFVDYLLTLHRLVGAQLAVKNRAGALRSQTNVIVGLHQGQRNLVLPSPEPERLRPMLGDIHRFLLSDGGPSPLVKAILANYQLIATQPFFDGNSRVAALMAEGFLRREGVIDARPMPIRLGVEPILGDMMEALYLVLRCSQWTRYVDAMVTVLNRTIAAVRDVELAP
ncbi:MAG: hypothetical protein E7812_00875 [Phenylobacterium sp.]|nr:MAG: hypothetical protein E7812_00875 [Phenylobacterium sp.]